MSTHVIQRSYKLRFYPTVEQVAVLNQCFGHARFVWNWALDMRQKAYQRRTESLNTNAISKRLTGLKRSERYGWLKDIPSTVLTQKLRDLDTAYTNFFEQRAKFPKFKKKSHNQAVRFQLDQRRIDQTFSFDERKLILPNLGSLKLRWSRRPQGKPKMVTVRRDAIGHHYVTFMVEESVEYLPQSDNRVGVDVGLRHLATLSNGEKFTNPRHLRLNQRRLRRAQRALSRRKRGSGRWYRAKHRVSKIHRRIGNLRENALHQLTTQLIRENQAIAVEELSVKGLMRTRLAKSFGDAAVSTLIHQLRYKSEWYGRDFGQAGKWYPSSKLCSTVGCDYKHPKLGLDVREWTCPQCGSVHDRDINAARNIVQAVYSLPAGSGDVKRVERAHPRTSFTGSGTLGSANPGRPSDTVRNRG